MKPMLKRLFWIISSAQTQKLTVHFWFHTDIKGIVRYCLAGLNTKLGCLNIDLNISRSWNLFLLSTHTHTNECFHPGCENTGEIKRTFKEILFFKLALVQYYSGTAEVAQESQVDFYLQ